MGRSQLTTRYVRDYFIISRSNMCVLILILCLTLEQAGVKAVAYGGQEFKSNKNSSLSSFDFKLCIFYRGGIELMVYVYQVFLKKKYIANHMKKKLVCS